ncbi:MAG: response regulator [Desulfuromonadales bacterium]|nr:response regulator [Desulfuromonadales bacterium]
MANEEIVVHVEDNQAHADLIRRQLNRIRPEVKLVHFVDGDAALRYLLNWPPQEAAPNLILLDLRLPKVDGIEVLRQLKAHPEVHRLPVVILSTSNAQQDLLDAYRHGANSYLVKPLEFEAFREMIAMLCLFWLGLNTEPDKSHLRHSEVAHAS